MINKIKNIVLKCAWIETIPIQGADGTNNFILDLKEYQVDSLIESLVKAKSMFTGTDKMIDSEFSHEKIEAWLEPNY